MPRCFHLGTSKLRWLEGYHKGLFDDTGKPTSAFNAFKR